MPAPERIKQLIETFEKNINEYHSYKNETELRRQFLDPFFETLGWDVDNKKGYDERNKEVAHEYSVEIEGQQKKADYAFRTGRDSFDFLVEAKKPSVKIEISLDPAFQLRRYGWSAGLPINILTDFEHFAVYDCRTRPNYSKDKVGTGRISIIHYKEYVERWDEIANLFSPESIRKGALDKYKDELKTKKGTQEVDEAFLEEIEAWRETLARNIATRNKHLNLNEDQVNFAVQMTIDRIIFLRIAEERGMERDRRLFELCEDTDIYKNLLNLFQQADARYNSGLFHFKKDKERESPDTLTPTLDIDDKVLKDIIKDLYYPSPYAFNYIPTEILGSVYERFLGKVIRLTAGGNAKVEDKPEVRKAGGVYYTPTYIVDYIVKNTVGRIVNPPATPDDVSKIKIVDPACGSGSFLLGAYQYLLDWHLDCYTSNDPEKHLKNKTILTADNKTYRLSIDEKKRILLNNIHGVDLDPQAVEVTKLSLLLKVVEDPGQLKMFEEGRILPDLNKNIKNGNALIGTDYFSGQMFGDMEEMKRVKPFDWKNEFPEVFRRGGFDVVIGNPPYGAELTIDDVKYFQTKHSVAEYQLDSYPLFIEKSSHLAKAKGHCGFIIPTAWVASKFDRSFRNFLASKTKIHSLVIAPKKTFGDATVETLILIFENQFSANNAFPIQRWDKDELEEYTFSQDDVLKQDDLAFQVYANPVEIELVSKIRHGKTKLLDYADAVWGVKIYQRGKGKPAQKGFELENKIFHSTKKTKSTHKPLIGGSEIKRYEINWKGEYVDYGQWLAEPRTPDWFTGPRILIREVTANGIIQASITDDNFVFSNSVDGVRLTNNIVDLRFILGLLNSKLISFYNRNTSANAFKGSFPKVLIKDLLNIPIPPGINERSLHDRMVSLVERMLVLHKSFAAAKSTQESELLQRQIKSTDRQIDELVYQLYGLSKEEQELVNNGS